MGLLQVTGSLDWGGILQQVGPWGVVVLVVADFVYHQVRVNRIRVDMEKESENRLDESNRRLITLMDARLAERDARIAELIEENKRLQKDLSESNGEVKNLSSRLDWTNTQLVEAKEKAALVGPLSDRVGRLKTQLESVEGDLKVERDLRQKAEERAEKLQIFYKRLEDDNQSLIAKNNRLGARLDEQAEQMTRLEEDRRHLSEKLSQMMAGVKDDLPMEPETVGVDDRRHSDIDPASSFDEPVSGGDGEAGDAG